MGFMIPSTLKYHTTSKLSLCDPSWPFKDSQPLCHPPYISLHQCDTALHQKDLLIRKHDIRQDAQSVTSKDFHGGPWQHVTSCKLLHKVNTLIWLILKSPVIPTLYCYRHNEFSVTLLYRFYKFLPIFFPLASSNNFPSILATLYWCSASVNVIKLAMTLWVGIIPGLFQHKDQLYFNEK